MARKARKRRQILMAALRVFARKGFQRATLREIAQEAGIGKSTIYEYFDSKTHLFQELVGFLFQNLERVAFGRLDPERPILEQLCGVLTAFAQFMQRSPFGSAKEILAITTDIFAESIRHGTVDLRPVYERETAVLRHLVAQGKERGEICSSLDPDTTASLIIAALDGLMTQWLLWPQEVDLEQRVQALCRLLQEGLGCASRPSIP